MKKIILFCLLFIFVSSVCIADSIDLETAETDFWLSISEEPSISIFVFEGWNYLIDPSGLRGVNDIEFEQIFGANHQFEEMYTIFIAENQADKYEELIEHEYNESFFAKELIEKKEIESYDNKKGEIYFSKDELFSDKTEYNAHAYYLIDEDIISLNFSFYEEHEFSFEDAEKIAQNISFSDVE